MRPPRLCFAMLKDSLLQSVHETLLGTLGMLPEVSCFSRPSTPVRVKVPV